MLGIVLAIGGAGRPRRSGPAGAPGQDRGADGVLGTDAGDRRAARRPSGARVPRGQGFRDRGALHARASSPSFPQAARDLVRHGVDVIVASGRGTAAKAAQMATSRIPIVFVGASDPVGVGTGEELRTARRQHHRDRRSGRRARAEADGDLPGARPAPEAGAPGLRRDECRCRRATGGASRRRPAARSHARGAAGADGGRGAGRHQRDSGRARWTASFASASSR